MEEFATPLYPQEPVQIKRPHILNLLAPFAWSLLMLLPAIVIIFSLDNIFGSTNPTVNLAVWLFGGVYGAFIVSYFMMYLIFWYLDAWLIMPTGLIDIQLVSLFNRRIAELNWGQVQDVRVAIRGALANLFNFGDVTVQSASRQGVFELRSIPHAHEVAKMIIELSSASRREEAGVAHGASPTQRIGEILIQQGRITPNELTLGLQEQKKSGKRLGQILVERSFISRDDLVKALAYQYHIPHIDLSRYDLEPEVVKLMPYETAVKYRAVPIDRSPDNVLSIAVAQPSNEVITDLMNQFDLPLTFLVADEYYIQEAITGHYLHEGPNSSGTPSTPPSTNLPTHFDDGSGANE
jgi:hypothetical protein